MTILAQTQTHSKPSATARLYSARTDTSAVATASLLSGKRISLQNLDTFHIYPKYSDWVFKFNPAQRLHKLFER